MLGHEFDRKYSPTFTNALLERSGIPLYNLANRPEYPQPESAQSVVMSDFIDELRVREENPLRIENMNNITPENFREWFDFELEMYRQDVPYSKLKFLNFSEDDLFLHLQGKIIKLEDEFNFLEEREIQKKLQWYQKFNKTLLRCYAPLGKITFAADSGFYRE